VILTPVADCMYPCYDPFEEDLEFDYTAYEDADEALAAIDRWSQRKRYMVGLFPGTNESCLQRDSICEFHPLVAIYEAHDV
jgi:hypothetical protein